jgi:HAD domain in Swiss Army Knife RNA repair proteins
MTDANNSFRKTIFLDIEGVVVTHRSILVQPSPKRSETYHEDRTGWHRFIDKTAMGLVYLLARDFGAQIVLTSILRGKTDTYSGLCEVAPPWVEDATAFVANEHTDKLGSREDGINLFIRENKVDKYVVIDDRNLKIKNFVWCNPRDGFSYDNYQQSRLFLADDPSTVKYELVFP